MPEAFAKKSLLAFLADHHVRIGDIESGNLNCLIESPSTTQKLPRRITSLGRYTFTGPALSAQVRTTIGRYCAIAHHVQLGPAEHPLSFLSVNNIFYARRAPTGRGAEYEYFAQQAADELERANGIQAEAARKSIVIGHDVWIGANVTVKRGVTIGNGSVIAANSFVAKDVRDYEIVGGVPARHIRFRFDERIIEVLMEVRWWELPLRDIASVHFTCIEHCIEELKEIRRSKQFNSNVLGLQFQIRSIDLNRFRLTKAGGDEYTPSKCADGDADCHQF